MRTWIRPLLLALPLLAAACSRPFDVKTAPGLVELDDQDHYAYRAIAPEGVVVGVKVIDIGDKGDLAFWARAATLRIRQLDGYAMLGVATSRPATARRAASCASATTRAASRTSTRCASS